MTYMLVEESAWQRLVEKVEALEHRNSLNRSTISRQPGLSIKTPEGVHVKPGGSIAVEGDSGVDLKPGGSIKVGGAGKIGVLGEKIGLFGAVEATGGVKAGGQVEGTSVKSLGDVNADGTVRGYAGVMMPIDGSMKQAGPQIEAARAVADSALANANSKPTVAYVDAGDASVRSRADDAWTLANGRATVSKQNEIIDKLNALDEFVAQQHPVKPYYPPVTKG